MTTNMNANNGTALKMPINSLPMMKPGKVLAEVMKPFLDRHKVFLQARLPISEMKALRANLESLVRYWKEDTDIISLHCFHLAPLIIALLITFDPCMIFFA